MHMHMCMYMCSRLAFKNTQTTHTIFWSPAASHHCPHAEPSAVNWGAGLKPLAGLRAAGRGGTHVQTGELAQSGAAMGKQRRLGAAGVGAQLLAKPIGIVEHAEGVARARGAGHVIATRLTCGSVTRGRSE